MIEMEIIHEANNSVTWVIPDSDKVRFLVSLVCFSDLKISLSRERYHKSHELPRETRKVYEQAKS